MPIRKGRAALREGRPLDAIAVLERGAKLRLRPADYDRMLAAAHLIAGQSDKAAPHLTRLAGRDPDWFVPVGKEDVARALVARGAYQELLDYDASVRERRESAEVDVYRAAAQLGIGRIADAETTLSRVNEGSVDPGRLQSLREALRERKEGSYPFVIGRDGRAIAAMQTESGDLVAVNIDFTPLVDRVGGPTSIEAQLTELGTATSIITTLDPFIQKAALFALGSQRGSIVAIDTRSNEILAIASASGEGTSENLALAQQYEPGSVIKVVTSLGALDTNIDLTAIFPLECEGFQVIENRQFFDWAKHGVVPDLSDATASSCNLAFGRMGLALGADRLNKLMQAAGFDRAVNLGYGSVALGRISGNPQSDYQVASHAIGLDHATITTLHLAMIGSAIANGGVFATPRLIRERRSILGDSVPVAAPDEGNRLASPLAAKTVLETMKAVMTSPRGTGRRAAVDGLPIAMKTGTAGEAQPGFDALIVAFAPADDPRIAIGMIAENAGPAEYAGARIAHDFFQQLKDRLR